MGETGGGRGRIRVHSRGGSNSVRGEGEQKQGEAGRQRMLVGHSLESGCFCFSGGSRWNVPPTTTILCSLTRKRKNRKAGSD